MKNFIFVIVMLTSSAFAGHGISMSAQGTGGTTHGDRNAACYKAESRAESAVESDCFREDGRLAELRFSSCDCRRKKGSKDDYKCSVTAYAQCKVRARVKNITAEGKGGTTHGDRRAACARAEDRALTNGENRCYSNGGQTQDYRFSSCDCRRKSGSKDDYACKVTAFIKCKMGSRGGRHDRNGGFDWGL